MSEKLKIYRNKEREKQTVHTPYVPQYKILGIEPEVHKSAQLSGSVTIAKPSILQDNDNPRSRKSGLRVELDEKPSSIGRGQLPNVGNNIEHTWSGVDGDIIDDITLDPNHKMIDNNNFFPEDNTPKSLDDLFPILSDLEEDSYLL